jgi:hypothetical protein
MLDAVFWYTGLVVWILVIIGCVATALIEAHGRSILKDERQIARGHLRKPRPRRRARPRGPAAAEDRGK